MDDAKWQRYAAFGGLAFVVLDAIGAFLPGAPPSTDDSPAKIARYYADHAGRIEVASFLGGLGLIGLLWWLGSVWRTMANAEGEQPRMAVVASTSLAVAISLALASFAVSSTVALQHRVVGESAKFFLVMTFALLSAGGFALVAHIAAVTSLSWRKQLFPQWINVVGWVASLAFLVATLGIASDAAWIGVFGLVSFVVWAIWVAAISVQLLQTRVTATA